MKGYIAPGKVITVTGPAAGVVAGQGVVVGTLFGIAQADAAAVDSPRASRSSRTAAAATPICTE